VVFLFLIVHVRSYTLGLRGGVHHILSLGIECRYALAKNGFLNIQHCVRGPTTLSTPRLQDSRLKYLDEIGAFLGRGTSHKRYRLATIILARHRPYLKRTINMESHRQPTNQHTRMQNAL